MKKYNNVLIFIFSLISVCFFVKDINIGANDRLLSDISIILVFFLPRIFSKIFKFKISDNLELTYIIFMIFAHFIGSIVNLYNTTWWYDIVMHFISGLVTAVIGLLVLNWFKMYKKSNKLFNALYIIMFVLFIASLWEFLEYGIDVFLNQNMQHVIETGVSDTMQDMLVAFLGSVIISFIDLYSDKIEKLLNVLK